MPNRETWIGKAAFVSFLLVVFSLGLMKPSIASPIGMLTLADTLFLITLALTALAVASGSIAFRWHRALSAGVFFFLAVVLAAIFSQDVTRSLVKVVGVGYLLLVACSAFTLVTTLSRLRLAVLAWLGGAALPIIVAVVGVLLFYVVPQNPWLSEITYHYGAAPVGYFPRVNSTMVSPSMLCNYLTVTLALAVVALHTGWIGKKLAVAVIIGISFAAAFTVSIALGGFILAAGWLMWWLGSRDAISRTALVASSFAAIGFLAISPIALNDAMNGAVAPSSRVLVWSSATDTFLAQPVTGKGPGLPVAEVLYKNSDGTTSLLTDAHNSFLSVAAQTGTVGLAAFLVLVFAVLRTGFRRYGQKEELDVIRFGMTIAFLCAFMYDGLTGSFEDARHLWVLIGLILATEQMPAERETC